nr:beta-glucuronosyltransferase GlcAT14B-like [Ipomoea batatas]
MGSSTNALEKKWVYPLAISSVVCIFLLVNFFNIGMVSSGKIFSIFPSRLATNETTSNDASKAKDEQSPPPPPSPSIPRFAYLISASKGDLEKLWRVLRVLYHPRNYYLVHLDLEATVDERLELASRLEREPVFLEVGNVHMITKANMVTYRGPTMVSNTLHASAILLRTYKDWDWYINLSASDYPLVTQDDLLSVFSDVRRDYNFIEHTSNLGWKEQGRGMPLMMDPGLYKNTKSDLFWVNPNRGLPTAFRLFTGSAWMMQSRAFVEYCIWGWENLPRTLLMYYTNFVSSPEGYFQTVICNVPQFIPTAINHDMHFISWDNPPRQHPRTLNINDTANIIASDAPFARKFRRDDPLLDRIDRELLGKINSSYTPGGWCEGDPPCSKVGDPTKLVPGPGAERLRRLVTKLILLTKFGNQQCN